MSYIQLIMAAISLAREIIKYLREKETDKTKRPEALKALKAGFQKARQDKDTKELESAFSRFL